jgi:DNA repair protein RadC
MLDLPLHTRPREKLLALGAGVLAERELLAIILHTGTSKLSALGLADELLTAFGGLERMAQASAEELLQMAGIGPAKAAQILAAIEFGRRTQNSQFKPGSQISTPRDVVQMMSEMRDYDREHFRILLLNTKNRVMSVKTVSIGTLASTIVHPRELFKEAIRRSAAALILVHNHPSGDPAPSREDISLTARLVSAGRILGIEVLDHVIIGHSCHCSMREEGYFPVTLAS